MEPRPTIAVVGASATGKSALALDLAEELGAEVIGADASQLYAGMDIGTAKVPLHERRDIPHHQIDVLEIHEEASVAAYQRAARADIEAVSARGMLPLLVGGSGLYVRAALDRLEIPPRDPDVRARLEHEAKSAGTPALLARLRAFDPQAAAHIEPRNTRRIVRALEVIELTGHQFSATMPTREFFRPTVVLGLRSNRPRLDARIATRTAAMWADGFVQEVAALEQRGLSRTRTAARAVGYAQALDQLAGRLSQDDAIEATSRATKRLVRRQESWFRADPRIHWLDGASPDLLSAALSVWERERLSTGVRD